MTELKHHISVNGRPSILPLRVNSFCCLSYWCECLILFHIGITYSVSEATAFRIVSYVENYLINANLFNLQKKIARGTGQNWKVAIVDATKILVQRPQKTKQKISYSGKKNPMQLDFRQLFIARSRKS